MLTKNLLLQMCSELTGVSLLFKVKQNGYKVLFASKDFLDWAERNFDIKENDLIGLSLNQIIKFRKLPYLKGHDIKASLNAVVKEEMNVVETSDFVDGNENKLVFTNIPLLDQDGNVGHILHQLEFKDSHTQKLPENGNYAANVLKNNDSISMLYEQSPNPMAILTMEGKIKSVNEAFLEKVFPLYKKNKMINEVFEIFSEIGVSDILLQAKSGEGTKIDLKLDKDKTLKYFKAEFISLKDDSHLLATLHDVTEIKKMRKDLVKKSMLMEDCLKFQKQDFDQMDIRDILKTSLSFMFTHADAHKGLIWVKDLSIDEKLGHQSEHLLDINWPTHKLNLLFLFDGDHRPTRNEPFTMRSNALANVGLLENSVSGFGKTIMAITGRKADHLLFVILLQMDATKVFDLEDKYVMNIISSCIFSELAGVFSGRMISGDDRM